jgi:2-dehydro-3-deoxyglucarate aldolase
MRKNPLKRALAEGEYTYGCWIQIGHPLVVELLAQAGFEWLVIDMEHSLIDFGELLPLLMSAEAQGVVSLVRVPENDHKTIGRVMDGGAYGVIVPNVKSRGDAQAAVSAVRYPKEGSRGVGLFRAQQHGRDFDGYREWLASESVVIVQIEDIDAVARVEEIFSVQGIDGFMIGPYDLSASMGLPGELDALEVREAVATVEEAARRVGLPAGYHSVSPDPGPALALKERGYRFLALSVDTIILTRAAGALLERVREAP